MLCPVARLQENRTRKWNRLMARLVSVCHLCVAVARTLWVGGRGQRKGRQFNANAWKKKI
jgi:hypothetical protein